MQQALCHLGHVFNPFAFLELGTGVGGAVSQKAHICPCRVLSQETEKGG